MGVNTLRLLTRDHNNTISNRNYITVLYCCILFEEKQKIFQNEFDL